MTETPARALRHLLEWIEANVSGERAAKADFPSLYLCRQALSLLEAPTGTQADLTERARVPVEKWFGRPGGYDHPMLPDVAAALQSERETAAAEARRAAIDEAVVAILEERCERGTPWDRALVKAANKVRSLASPPAPQEETR